MESRNVTNLLLAVIAGVLLFGKEAITGSLQTLFYVAIVIGVIYLLLIGANALLQIVLDSYREAETWSEVAVNIGGLIFAGFAIPLIGYTALLWFDGVERPINVVLESKLGIAYQYFFMGVMGIAALTAASSAIYWLIQNRTDFPIYINYGARWIGALVVAPVMFPVREWRSKSKDGANIFVRVTSTLFAFFLGLFVAYLVLLAAGIILILIFNV